MNIPTGKAIAKGLFTSELSPIKVLQDLKSKQFSGYLSVTSKSNNGFEDGILIFKKGLAVGSYYQILKNNHEEFSNIALDLTLNALQSEYGTIDISALSSEQVDLIITFNEKVSIASVDLQTKIQKYDSNKSSKFYTNNEDESKYELLKKIGLEGIKI